MEKRDFDVQLTGNQKQVRAVWKSEGWAARECLLVEGRRGFLRVLLSWDLIGRRPRDGRLTILTVQTFGGARRASAFGRSDVLGEA